MAVTNEDLREIEECIFRQLPVDPALRAYIRDGLEVYRVNHGLAGDEWRFCNPTAFEAMVADDQRLSSQMVRHGGAPIDRQYREAVNAIPV